MANAALSAQFLPKDMAVRKDLDIRTGDTVRVHVKIQEKDKTRIQVFEGLVLARNHGSETGGTFTVRKIASGVGVERVFPLYSPMIEKVEVVRRTRTRRAKLYFIRTKVARQIRRKMRNFIEYFATSDSLIVPESEMLEAIEEEETPVINSDTPAEEPKKEEVSEPVENVEPKEESASEGTEQEAPTE